MKPLLLDTNILLRFVTGEPESQAREAARLVAAAEAGEIRLAVLPMVLAEAVFVLTGFYKHPRSKVAEVLSHLIASPGFDSAQQDQMLHALKLFGSGKLDFVDCYLATVSLIEEWTLVSYDRDLAKLQGIGIRKPADCVERCN